MPCLILDSRQNRNLDKAKAVYVMPCLILDSRQNNESEVLFMQGVRHQVRKIARGRGGTPTYVYVTEQQ